MTTKFPSSVNPALFNWDGPLGLPGYDQFEVKDFAPGFDYALKAHLDEIDAIANNGAPATFENTIEALELAGDALSKVARIFYNLSGAHTNDAIQALERDLAPKMAEHSSKISMNKALFERTDAVYQQRDSLNLDAEALRVLEQHWKGFVRSGAKLNNKDQKELAGINAELAGYYTGFGQNILADEAEYLRLIEEESDLAGLPDSLIDSMAQAAEEKGHKDKHAVTLSRSIIEPFLTFCQNRELREECFKAWVSRGEGKHDNMKLVADIVPLRAKKAKLLGYASFADYKLEDTMAKTPANVNNLLETVWEKAKAKAAREAEDLASLIAQEGKNHKVAPWDWRYYSEKLRTERFSFDETEVKAYFQLDRIIEAAFDTATKLFGISFKEQEGVPLWHPDVRVWEVLDKSGKHLAVFTGDYFARSSKRSGAWASALESQHKLGDGATPIIMNTMNFAKPPKGQPVLISIDEAKTLFHEFGHALHGMLSNVRFPSVAGTNTSRDWVELPSQLYEHWLTVPENLSKYAVHHKTGEAIPRDLMQKVLDADTFNSGFDNVEFTSSALVDMAFHALDENEAKDIDPKAFQQQILERIGMPEEITMRHATPHFAHVFSGDGYSAGYYSYMWSGVLDSDAFRAFEEAGNPFDEEMAAKLKQHIYSSGDSIDPEKAYIAFRGALPTPDALLEKRGLV